MLRWIKKKLKFLTKKDREILNLEAKVENRDKLINDQVRTIEGLKSVINSLEEDLKSARNASYEMIKDLGKNTTGKKDTAKKTTTKKNTTKKKTTKKETTSKNTTSKK